jgi:hypothetical protein
MFILAGSPLGPALLLTKTPMRHQGLTGDLESSSSLLMQEKNSRTVLQGPRSHFFPHALRDTR